MAQNLADRGGLDPPVQAAQGLRDALGELRVA
jgi:hypothetical protein